MINLFPFARPFLNMIDGESAHRLTIEGLKLLPSRTAPARTDEPLAVDAFGFRFPNPLGLAAGFDKDGEVFEACLGMGLGFVEIGGVTPLAQPGNPKPRVFRLNRDHAVINRYGLNSAGMTTMRERLAKRRREAGIVGVNIGANKESTDRSADYATLVSGLADVADYISVNISSPNTPGLRNLQGREALDDLLARVMEAKFKTGANCPILVKIAPDLELRDLDDIIAVARARQIDGLIISNTTIKRPDSLIEKNLAGETGGLSGRPVFEPSTRLLANAWLRVEGAFPLIGVGGIESGETAWAKIEAGATLLQLYTALVFQGPGLVGQILRDMTGRLKRSGEESLKAVVGCRAREWAGTSTV